MHVGLLGTKRIHVADVTQVHWRLFARDVVLRGKGRRLRIEIDVLSPSDRAEIVSYLRRRFPPELHRGWERAGRTLKASKAEPIHWGRVAGGTAAAAGLAVPLLFLAAWVAEPDRVDTVFVLTFFPTLAALLIIGDKLGFIRLPQSRNAP